MSENKAHLLLVDDDAYIILLSAYLSKNNFLISSANILQRLDVSDYFAFDLLVIDIMMPGEWSRVARKILESKQMFAIFLARRSKDKISGLEIEPMITYLNPLSQKSSCLDWRDY